jgi:type I restriction enzyme S subunit
MSAWPLVKLNELCEIKTGRKDVNEGNPNGKYPFFTCAKEHTYSDQFSFDGEAILIAGNGVVGNTSYYNGKFEAYQRTYVLMDFLDVNPKYLYLILEATLKDALVDQKLGNTMPYIKKGMLTDYLIPIPPLPEQMRLVALLDTVFADLEQARTKTEQNLKNARELFVSYLQKVFSQKGEGWSVKKISDIADTCLGKMLDKKKNKGNFKPYLRNLNVQWFNINTNDLLDMKFEDSEYERYAVKKGDLVICEGGYPGRGAIWEQDEDIFFQKALHRIRSHDTIYNQWILYYLYLSDCNGSLKSNFTGAGIQHFTGKALKQLSLPVPDTITAEKYILKIDELLKEVKLLENIYNKKLSAIDELKTSILQKAFSGELTTTAK